MIVYHGSYIEIKQIDLTDFNFDEKTAIDKFFSSNTFSKLADTSNKLYEKDWTEIYDLLLNELKL
jgi:predicted NACHT family NTPase